MKVQQGLEQPRPHRLSRDEPTTEFHPAADLFPLLEGEELQSLCDDIRSRGLLDPIVRHEGKILDGRNRYRACQLAGIMARFVDWDGEGGSPLTYVVSKNLRRRHLTASQRALLAADALALFEEQAKERHKAGSARGGAGSKAVATLPPPSKRKARDDAAREYQVSPRYVQDAKRLKEKVASGELPTSVEEEVRSGAASLQRAEGRGRRARASGRSQGRQSSPVPPGPPEPPATPAPSGWFTGPSLTEAGRPVASELAAVLASVLQVIRVHRDHPRLEADLRALFEEIDPSLRQFFVQASQLSMKAQALFRSEP
ncbi:MAG: ParB N-terminal domain-containing protein [Planctomycetota bacterium]